MKISTISVQGLREHMEDKYFLDANFLNKGCIYAGIYDGHGGDMAASIAAKELHNHLQNCVSLHPLTEAFKCAYENISEEIISQTESGTCAVDFLIKEDEIIFANAGDSKLFVIGEGMKELTTVHRLDSETEKIRITQSGGSIRNKYVFTGFRGLAITRSLGDKYHKQVGVVATPDVGTYLILPTDKFIIAGTDGLFDYLSNEQILDIVTKNTKNRASILKNEALKMGSKDNITVMVFDLYSS